MIMLMCCGKAGNGANTAEYGNAIESTWLPLHDFLDTAASLVTANSCASSVGAILETSVRKFSTANDT